MNNPYALGSFLMCMRRRMYFTYLLQELKTTPLKHDFIMMRTFGVHHSIAYIHKSSLNAREICIRDVPCGRFVVNLFSLSYSYHGKVMHMQQ